MAKARKKIMVEGMQHYRLKKDTGPHSPILSGVRKYLKPGDSFDAYPAEVKGWLHKIELIEEGGDVVTGEELETRIEKEEAVIDFVPLKVVHKGAGRYVVINTETEEQLNDGYLSKEEAEALVAEE